MNPSKYLAHIRQFIESVRFFDYLQYDLLQLEYIPMGCKTPHGLNLSKIVYLIQTEKKTKHVLILTHFKMPNRFNSTRTRPFGTQSLIYCMGL